MQQRDTGEQRDTFGASRDNLLLVHQYPLPRKNHWCFMTYLFIDRVVATLGLRLSRGRRCESCKSMNEDMDGYRVCEVDMPHLIHC
jgi:hypothetical protein